MVQTKLQFQAVLDQVFPEYKGVFGDLYVEISLKTLHKFPTSESVLKAGIEEIAQFIDKHCKARSFNWAHERGVLGFYLLFYNSSNIDLIIQF